MKSLPNIDKSAFHKGEYVGYANGVWKIRRCESGWTAVKRDAPYVSMTAATLESLSAKLALHV